VNHFQLAINVRLLWRLDSVIPRGCDVGRT